MDPAATAEQNVLPKPSTESITLVLKMLGAGTSQGEELIFNIPICS